MICYHCKEEIEGSPVLPMEWADNPFCSWKCVEKLNEKVKNQSRWAILNGCEVYLKSE